ncbi:MAG TPA: DHA2 family efflux MFS transporter permease subunit [Mycobacteriales bacterium]|nr:DHA2 family efflux MFS transporter permease subunit [Mycobacteriales bacterium]
MTALADAPAVSHLTRSGRPIHKNLVLVTVAIAQLMVVLDATIVNVAIPAISDALKVKNAADLSWVVTGYTLTFGGFLLLGGKLADKLGRRAVFIAGAALFAVASLVGGLSQDLTTLVAMRTIQGVGGALMSPAALSIITVVFEEGKERNKALGIWAAITAGGAALGLILGGVLTEYASWRWVLFVNVPIAVIAIVGALRFVPESRDERTSGFDIPGAILVTGGLMALVFALVKGNEYGWGDMRTIRMLALATVLLVAFLQVQIVSEHPLVPTRLFRSHSVAGADIGALFLGAGVFAMFFFLILWMQQVNGYSPIKAGVAFLPMTLMIGAAAGISSNLLGKIGPRPLLLVGPLLAAFGMFQLGFRLEVDSSYTTVILPALACVALGMGTTFVALTSSAVAGVPHEDAGMASALLNAGQQVGGALGLAILTAVSATRTEQLFPGHQAAQDQIQHAQQNGEPLSAELSSVFAKLTHDTVAGWSAGFLLAAALLAMSALVFQLMVRVSKEDAAAALKDAMAAG